MFINFFGDPTVTHFRLWFLIVRSIVSLAYVWVCQQIISGFSEQTILAIVFLEKSSYPFVHIYVWCGLINLPRKKKTSCLPYLWLFGGMIDNYNCCRCELWLMRKLFMSTWMMYVRVPLASSSSCIGVEFCRGFFCFILLTHIGRSTGNFNSIVILSPDPMPRIV